MFERHNLTVDQLKEYFTARYHFERRVAAEVKAYLQEKLPHQNFDEHPFQEVFGQRFNEWYSNLLAIRLIANDRAAPILQPEDAEKIPSLSLKDIRANLSPEERLVFDQNSPEEKKEGRNYLNRLMREFFFHQLTAVMDMAPKVDHYENNWKEIEFVFTFAKKQGISPVEVFASQEQVYAMTRERHSREEFIENNMKALGILNTDFLKKIVFDPQVAMFADGDKDMAAALEKDLREDILPEVKRQLAERQLALVERLKGVVDDIYGPK